MLGLLPRLKNKAWHIVVYLLDSLWAKDSSLVLFGQKRGAFSDNSRALFEYMADNSSMKAIWLTDNRSLIDNKRFFDANSWHGFKLAMRAKTFIVSHGAGDISYSGSFSPRKNFIVVWHGIPLKRIALLDAKLKGSKRIQMVKKEIAKYDYYIAASEAEAETLKRCRELPDTSKIRVTGLPRNDALLRAVEPTKLNVSKTLLEKLKGKIILYAPTFRDNDETKFLPFKEADFEQIYEVLESENAHLLFRPHPNDTANIQRLKSICEHYGERFVLADNTQVPDVAELLPYVDTIVTDYSSIYIDLLLLDCPCVFIPYDLEQYEFERGFLYDYDSVTPGPKIASLSAFVEALKSSLSDPEYFRSERQKVRKLFHLHQDAYAAKRVSELVEQVAKP